MKKSLVIIVCLILILSLSFTSAFSFSELWKKITGQATTSTNSYICNPGQAIGDLDNDGYFTVKDTSLIGDIYYGRISMPSNICCADANQDGGIDTGDILKVLRMVSGLEASPGKCCPTGQAWDGSTCIKNCLDAGGDVCSYYVLNAYKISGSCNTGGCYKCNEGYSWDGTKCVIKTEATIVANNYVCNSNQAIGDLDNDGYFTVKDTSLIGDIYYGRISMPSNICCADANQDGGIDTGDILKITRIASGLDSSPGTCQSSVCVDSSWTDFSACSGCTPAECNVCTGTKTQKSNCGNTKSVSCTIPATGCSGKVCSGSYSVEKKCNPANNECGAYGTKTFCDYGCYLETGECKEKTCIKGTCTSKEEIECGKEIPSPNECTECKGTGTKCEVGQTCNGGVCKQNCNTGLGCGIYFKDAHVVKDKYCRFFGCWECNTGYTWDGSKCFKETCEQAGGNYCGASLNNAHSLGKDYCKYYECWKCDDGYEYKDGKCVGQSRISAKRIIAEPGILTESTEEVGGTEEVEEPEKVERTKTCLELGGSGGYAGCYASCNGLDSISQGDSYCGALASGRFGKCCKPKTIDTDSSKNNELMLECALTGENCDSIENLGKRAVAKEQFAVSNCDSSFCENDICRNKVGYFCFSIDRETDCELNKRLEANCICGSSECEANNYCVNGYCTSTYYEKGTSRNQPYKEDYNINKLKGSSKNCDVPYDLDEISVSRDYLFYSTDFYSGRVINRYFPGWASDSEGLPCGKDSGADKCANWNTVKDTYVYCKPITWSNPFGCDGIANIELSCNTPASPNYVCIENEKSYAYCIDADETEKACNKAPSELNWKWLANIQQCCGDDSGEIYMSNENFENCCKSNERIDDNGNCVRELTSFN